MSTNWLFFIVIARLAVGAGFSSSCGASSSSFWGGVSAIASFAAPETAAPEIAAAPVVAAPEIAAAVCACVWAPLPLAAAGTDGAEGADGALEALEASRPERLVSELGPAGGWF